MPGEDSALVRTPSDAVRYSGNAPSVVRAWSEGRSVYGVAFPTGGVNYHVPPAGDSGGYEHYLEGGRTAVRLPDPNGGYLRNPTHEFVTPGGAPVPSGSVLFKVESNGSWTIVKRY